jgi:hypothetical protein
MPAAQITTLDGLIAALSAGQKRALNKASQTSEGAGTWHSLWKAAGNPAAGSNPGSLAGAIPTDATTGAIPFTNATFNYLLRLAASGTVAGTLIIYDRLWHNSTMSGTVTTDTTLGATPDLTRPDALGANTELWGEIYSAIGASAATLNVKYTDQDGNTGQNATYAHPANAESVGQMFPLVLAAGDTGVRKATSYNWSVTTGTAGDFGLTILRRIAEIQLSPANAANLADWAALGLPQIYDDACLAMMVQCTATTTGLLLGSLVIG